MKKIFLIFAIVFSLVLISPTFDINNSDAQSCSGTRICRNTTIQCNFPFCLGTNNPPGSGCICNPVTQDYQVACTGIPASGTCSSEPCIVGDTVVSDNCGASTCDASNCFNRACTSGGQSCTCYGVCSGGSCITGGVVPGTCTGGSTPTPTTAPDACAPFGGQAGCDAWCQSNGAAGCNIGCVGCFGAPTPPGGGGSPPTPTTAPPGGGGSSCLFCPPSGVCYDSCCTCSGPWGDCSACPVGCTPNGSPEGAGGCCSGYSSGGICQDPPVCSGCQFWNGSFCQDGDFLCSAGQTCSGGTCIDPTYTISGKVFVDTNGNGVQNCSGSCDNGAGDELNYQGATVTRNPSGQTSTTNSSGNYSFTNLSAFIYTISLTLPSGYTATTANPRSVTVGPSQTANFGIIQNPADCPTEITASTNTVNSGGTVNLSMSGCTGVENPPDGSSPPPFDWDPPQDDNPGDEGDPQCSDGVDNDGDGLIDTNDPGCHWDGDSTNPGSYRPNDDNEANVSGPRQCNDGIDNDSDGFVDLADPGCDNSSDDNESDRLSPGKSGSTTCSDSELAVVSTTSTSSTATWTAPACATSQLICTITGVVNGPGGTDTYTENITVRQTGVINVDVRDVSDGQPCDASAPLYTGSTTLGLSGAVTTTETITDGTYSFACLPNSNYTVSLGLPAGYQIFTGGTSQATSITDGIKTRDIRFCIANFEPWYQTTQGDVRMRGIVNPIPAGLVGSTDATSPSVFFSTQYSAEVDAGGGLSAKNWLVNREYDYNSLTRNRNGVVAHSFYKSRARQEGIPITQLTSGTLDNNNTEVLENGVYEWTGDMVIDGYSQVAERAVILVDGNVTISSEVAIPLGSLFIVAASGNITVAAGVGHASPNFNTTVPNLEGIYSAEGDIVLEGGECTGGVPDERLNVAGALIANAQKPFASTGGGAVQNQRSLCANDDLYPSLYVSSRPDFLTKLTDFYKVSYTKWREVRP